MSSTTLQLQSFLCISNMYNMNFEKNISRFYIIIYTYIHTHIWIDIFFRVTHPKEPSRGRIHPSPTTTIGGNLEQPSVEPNFGGLNPIFRIHGTNGVFTYIDPIEINYINVGKYTSPMDPENGNGKNKECIHGTLWWRCFDWKFCWAFVFWGVDSLTFKHRERSFGEKGMHIRKWAYTWIDICSK